MKIYVVTAEVSYIRCDTPRDETERKGTHIQGGFKTVEEAEKCIQDKMDEVAKLCETEPLNHHDFTRYEHGCHWLDTFTTKGSSWFIMECNFMVEHDMTVVNEKGNKYKVNPKEKSLYMISTIDPHGRPMKDTIHIEHGFQSDKWILDHVLDSSEYKTKGIVQSGWLRGNVYKVVSPAETDAILQFCKIALKSVFRQAAERYEIEKSYNPEI